MVPPIEPIVDSSMPGNEAVGGPELKINLLLYYQQFNSQSMALEITDFRYSRIVVSDFGEGATGRGIHLGR
jgi:hypothetical protein